MHGGGYNFSNHRFIRVAPDGVDLHRRIGQETDVQAVLCILKTRTVGRNWCVYQSPCMLQIDRKPASTEWAARKVELLCLPGGILKLRHGGQTLQ